METQERSLGEEVPEDLWLGTSKYHFEKPALQRNLRAGRQIENRAKMCYGGVKGDDEGNNCSFRCDGRVNRSATSKTRKAVRKDDRGDRKKKKRGGSSWPYAGPRIVPPSV